jgi:hypothetical protein
VGHFSFEYPSYYHVALVEIEEDHGYTDIAIEGPWQEEERISSSIDLFIIKADSNYPDAKTVLERDLAFVSSWPDFTLLERSATSVGGIPGEQFTFYYTGVHMVHPPPDAKATPAIMLTVYFDYGGNIWSFGLTSSETTFDNDRIDFEYVLSTFKILD